MNNNYVIDDTNKLIHFNKLDEYGVINGFTLKPFDFRSNYVLEETIQENIEKLEDIFKYTFAVRMQPHQTHTNIVKVIDGDNLNETFEDVDGLITNLKGILLTSILADCQGLLLYDNNKKVVGSIHSGWKGTLNRIGSNAIQLMVDTYGCNVDDIEVFMSPSILSCCFEVQDDVYNLFIEEFKDIDINGCIRIGNIIDGNQKYYIDITKINKNVLMNMGIKEEHIYENDLCSKCHKDIIHSHRGDGMLSGRNIAFICLK